MREETRDTIKSSGRRSNVNRHSDREAPLHRQTEAILAGVIFCSPPPRCTAFDPPHALDADSIVGVARRLPVAAARCLSKHRIASLGVLASLMMLDARLPSLCLLTST